VQEVAFPTRNEVEGGRRPVCTSAARKIGVPLARARDGVPQRACFPWLCAERMNAFGEGVAGRNGPLRRLSEDGSVIAGWRLGGGILPLLGRSAFALTLFQTLSKRETGQKWEGLMKGI
jgi:hypothetical protein